MPPDQKFQPSDEWRSRFDIVRVHAKNKIEFVALRPDLLKCLLDLEKIDFVVYMAHGWELFEFLRPRDFSKDLVKEFLTELKAHPDALKACIKADQYFRYERVAMALFDKRFSEQTKHASLAYSSAIKIYRPLFIVSQSLFRGRLDAESYARIARVVSEAVSSFCSTRDALRLLVDVVGHDPILYDHQAVSTFLTIAIAWNSMKVSKRDTKVIGQSALMHDLERHCAYLGHTAVRDRISDSVVAEVSELIAAGKGFSAANLEVLQQFRERFAGGGFPRQLCGRSEENALSGIALSARIVALCCGFSEYLLKRQDKKPLTQDQIFDFLADRVGSGEFDPKILHALTSDATSGEIRSQERVKQSTESDEDFEDDSFDDMT